MKLEDAPPTQRPNLHHTHDDVPAGATHEHDIVDHYGRSFEKVLHTHDPDGNVTANGGRYKPAKQRFDN